MRKFHQTYYEALEELEYHRLKDKYEPLGYEFVEKLAGLEVSLEPDAIAKHKESGELLFFEIKAFASDERFSKRAFQEQLKTLKSRFPTNARFLLVVARPRPKHEVYLEGLDSLLLELLKRDYVDEFRSKISGITSFESVDDLSISKLTLRDHKVRIEGFATIKFFFAREDEEIIFSLSDGVPFKFSLNQVDRFPFYLYPLVIDFIEDHKISFDYSEFVDKE
ncbi:MAG: hypothetical protein IPL46_08105 [Saprospiraceae bacterium]|nr:hypothetical protein [Saprospiraceae bacterium]